MYKYSVAAFAEKLFDLFLIYGAGGSHRAAVRIQSLLERESE